MNWSRAIYVVFGGAWVALALVVGPAGADPCTWEGSSHVLPSGPAPGGFTQGGGTVWFMTGVDFPGSVEMLSFDPWEGTDSLIPDSLCSHWVPAMAFLDGAVYVISGGNTCVERYTADTGWTAVASLPAVKDGASAEVLDGKIYIFGGYGDAETYIYDPDVDAWEAAGPAMVHAGGNRASTVHGDCIYAMGGAEAGSDAPGHDWSERYCLGDTAWEDLAPLPVPRNGARAVTVGDQIYLLGGRSGDSGTVDNQVWVFDTTPAEDQIWTQHDFPMLKNRFFHAVAVYGVAIYSIGGNGANTGPTDTIERLITTSACSDVCDADVNGDGSVDPLDSGFVSARFGLSCLE